MKEVVAALIVQNEKVLICQRTRHQNMPLKWEFPGGKIEPGEKPEEALRRELEEELGIRASIGQKVATVQHDYGHGPAVALQFFVVKEFTGDIQNRIFHDVRWVSPANINSFDFLDADTGLVNDLSAGRLSLSLTCNERRPDHGDS